MCVLDVQDDLISYYKQYVKKWYTTHGISCPTHKTINTFKSLNPTILLESPNSITNSVLEEVLGKKHCVRVCQNSSTSENLETCVKESFQRNLTWKATTKTKTKKNC